MRRALVVAVALALVTVACERGYPADERWANGRYVHPHFVPPPPPPDYWARATCWIGMTDLGEATVWSWLQDPGLENEEEWSSWFYSDFLGGIADRQACLESWVHEAPIMGHSYSCGGVDVPRWYWGAGWQDDMLFFRLHYLCDSHGYAFFPCFPDCGLGYAATEGPLTEGPLTDTQQAVAMGGVVDPTGQYIVDPNDPYPVEPCALDPRDLRYTATSCPSG